MAHRRRKMPAPVAGGVAEAGQISDLIRAEKLLCIVRLNSHEARKALPFETVEPQRTSNAAG